MKFLIIPVVQCIYYLSVVFKANFWNGTYRGLTNQWDLSPNQTWFLPLGFNLLVAAMGLPYLWCYLRSRKNGAMASKLRSISALVCATVTMLIFSASAMLSHLKSENLFAAVKEVRKEGSKDVFSAGQIDDGVYSNPIIGIQITLPKDYVTMSKNSMLRASEAGGRAIDAARGEQSPDTTQSPPGLFQLLAVRKYPQTHKGYNPSLMITAFQKDLLAEAGIPTLGSFIDLHAQTSPPHSLEMDPTSFQFGDVEGFSLWIRGDFPSSTVYQRMYAIETDGYYVTLVASFQIRQDFTPLYASIRTLRVNQ